MSKWIEKISILLLLVTGCKVIFSIKLSTAIKDFSLKTVFSDIRQFDFIMFFVSIIIFYLVFKGGSKND